MIQLFNELSQLCTKETTRKYSTSFASAIQLIHHDLRPHIYNIYGVVRFADEIVDSFHEYDKRALLEEFKTETFLAIERGISLNPILHSFQMTVNKFNIPLDLIEAFYRSMEMDLKFESYDLNKYEKYIYGSAEVVGLMCLYVFCEGDQTAYEKLKPYAQSLGAAFQKVNFLRDVKADYLGLGRVYFPNVDFNNFSADLKRQIENDIANDFKNSFEGILQLPAKSRFGVYVAYKYYLSLFNKITKTKPANILEKRIRIPNYNKLFIVLNAGLRSQLNLL